jgi:hypothetical protein
VFSLFLLCLYFIINFYTKKVPKWVWENENVCSITLIAYLKRIWMPCIRYKKKKKKKKSVVSFKKIRASLRWQWRTTIQQLLFSERDFREWERGRETVLWTCHAWMHEWGLWKVVGGWFPEFLFYLQLEYFQTCMKGVRLVYT